MPQTSVSPRATERGLRLLVAVADRPAGAALAELARTVELSSSTALRQLRALESAGLAARDQSGRYVPGTELMRIARSLSARATLPALAAPMLAALSDRTGESCYLAEPLDDDRAVYVAMEQGRHAIRHVSWLGQTVPLRGTAVGQALCGQVGADGAVERRDAVEEGVVAASAPVRSRDGQIVAAMSVVGPSSRLRGKPLRLARASVTAAAAELGAQLDEGPHGNALR
jgi:IclR family transcriptional regulator, acetate operon repressor